jgi:hypothetical protein
MGFLVLEVPEGGLHCLVEFVIVGLDLGLPVLYRVLEKRRFSLYLNLGSTDREETPGKADMAMVHKILHGRGGLDYTTWFERAENGPRATR